MGLAVANRHQVTLWLDPLPADIFGPDLRGLQIDAPLYLVLFATLVVGSLIGALMVWLAGGKTRRALRVARREAKQMRNDLARETPARKAEPAVDPDEIENGTARPMLTSDRS